MPDIEGNRMEKCNSFVLNFKTLCMTSQSNGSVRLLVDESKFTLNRKYLKHIADEYQISESTMNRWLKRHAITVSRGYISSTKQIEIYDKLGWPECHLRVSAA